MAREVLDRSRPDATTEVNEARMEHTQRVAAARQLFGRADPPGWDARGEILIRFGPPSFRTSIMGDVTSLGLELPQEYWYYDALNMSVTFTDINLMGRFTYATPERCLRAPGPPIPGWRQRTLRAADHGLCRERGYSQ